jgi:hypothetical protein
MISKVFGFKMKYGIEVIIMCRVNASLSTTLINSSKFPLSKSQSVGLDYRALGQIAFGIGMVVHQIRPTVLETCFSLCRLIRWYLGNSWNFCELYLEIRPVNQSFL